MSNDKVEATFHGQRRFDVLGAVEAIGREEENEKLRTEVDRLTATLDRVRAEERAKAFRYVASGQGGLSGYVSAPLGSVLYMMAEDLDGPAPADPDE